MELKYYRKEQMIFGVYRGESRAVQSVKDGALVFQMEPIDKDKLDLGMKPKLDKAGEKIPVMESKYFPHEHEGKPNFEEIIFKGKSIGDAKRESRKLQGSPRGLGSLRVLRA